MAYIWHMAVSFATEGLARAFADNFDRREFDVPHAGGVNLAVGVETTDSGWEVCVLPKVGTSHLNGHGSACSPEEVADIDACAKVLYDRLSTAKSQGYRFALTGFEVGDWRSAGELADDLSPRGLFEEQRRKGHARGWEGLVVSDHLWWVAERPEGFVRFAADYMWLPFKSIEGVE
jgi:hypothetical protein